MQISVSGKNIDTGLAFQEHAEKSLNTVVEKYFHNAVISDDQALRAVATLFKHLKIVVEPGGAVAVAAALTEQVPSGVKTVVAVASGGNIDSAMFNRALEAGAFF